MCQPLGVLLVHLSEGAHVSQEDVDLDDLVEARASLCQDSLEVLEDLGRLLGDGTLDQVTL